VPNERATSEGMQERIRQLVGFLNKHPGSSAWDVQSHFEWNNGTWATTSAKAKDQKLVKMTDTKITARWSA
jgi:hypothetical protein